MDHSLEPFNSQRTYPKFQELLAQHRVRHLATLCLGTRYLTANSPINSVEGLKGLKLRLPNDRTWSSVWQALGASTMNVPFPELKTTIEVGLVEAQENPPALIRSANLHQVQKYLIQTKHYFQRQFIIVSSRYFDSMDTKKQQMVSNAARETAARFCEETQNVETDDIKWLTSKGGMTLVEFNRDGIAKIVKETYKNKLSNDPNNEIEKIVGIR
jgi:TRAP-type transport system periplasmic protein